MAFVIHSEKEIDPHLQQEKKKHRFIMRQLLLFLSSVSLIAVFLLTLFLPKLTAYFQASGQMPDHPYLLIFLYVTLIPFILVLVLFFYLAYSLARDQIFLPKMIKALKAIQVTLLIEFAFYTVALLVRPLLLTLVILCGIALLLIAATVVKEIILAGQTYYEDSNLAI